MGSKAPSGDTEGLSLRKAAGVLGQGHTGTEGSEVPHAGPSSSRAEWGMASALVAMVTRRSKVAS